MMNIGLRELKVRLMEFSSFVFLDFLVDGDTLHLLRA